MECDVGRWDTGICIFVCVTKCELRIDFLVFLGIFNLLNFEWIRILFLLIHTENNERAFLALTIHSMLLNLFFLLP